VPDERKGSFCFAMPPKQGQFAQRRSYSNFNYIRVRVFILNGAPELFRCWFDAVFCGLACARPCEIGVHLGKFLVATKAELVSYPGKTGIE
jgi:hypothetical protein